ncbi:tetratricopeptide repeat protein [Breznakiellaceae bacterium SP9]
MKRIDVQRLFLCSAIIAFMLGCSSAPTTQRTGANTQTAAAASPVNAAASTSLFTWLEKAVTEPSGALRIGTIGDIPLFIKTAEGDPQNAYTPADSAVFDKVIAKNTPVLERDPEDLDAALQLAAAYHGKGDLPQAFVYMEEAMRIDPELLDAYYLRGLMYLDAGDYVSAMSDFWAALNMTTINLTFVNYSLAQAYHKMDDKAGAIEFFEEVKKLDADFGNVSQILARLKT